MKVSSAIRSNEGKLKFNEAKLQVVNGKSEVYFVADGFNRLICREANRVMYFVCDSNDNPMGNGKELCEWCNYSEWRKLHLQ